MNFEKSVDGQAPTEKKTQSQSIEVVKTEDGSFLIRADHVEITPQSSVDLVATLEKQVHQVRNGEDILGVATDLDSPDLKQIRSQAEELRKIPETERPRALISLIRSSVDYPYKWLIKELLVSDSQKAKWVIEALKTKQASLSESVKFGLAECGQFAALLLALGVDAGLQGTFAAYQHIDGLNTNILNISRLDNGEQLFKSIGLNEVLTEGHAWVEFLISDGSWMPADPATQLVGDSPEGLATFREANYHAYVSDSCLYDDGLPPYIYLNSADLFMGPGQSKKTGLIKIEAAIAYDDQGGRETSYSGPLNFTINSRPEIMTSYLPVKLIDLKEAD